MSSLEERIQAIRDKRGAQAAPRVSLEDRLASIRARRTDAPTDPLASIDKSEESQSLSQRINAPQIKTPVDPDSFDSTIGRSVDQMQASLGGAVEAGGEIVGSQFLQDAGADYRKQQLDEASQYGTPSISSYKQVDFSDPEQVGTYLKQMGLSSVPGLVSGITTSVAGAKAGGAIGGPRGAVAGGILGALTSALPLNIGEVQNAIKQIDPEAKSPWSAVLGGTAMSALDVVGLTSIAKPLVKTFGKDIAYQALKEQGVSKEVALGAVKGALVEAPTEAIQTAISANAAAGGTNTDVDVEKLIEDMINSSVGGTVGGSAMGGAVSGYAATRNNDMIENTASEGPQFAEGRTKPLNMAQRAWDALGSSSTALLEPLARVSPSMEGVIRKLRPDMTGEKATDATVFEDADLMVGKWTSKMEEGLRGKDIDQALEDYLNSVQTPESRVIEETLGDVLNTAKVDGGLDVGQVSNYLPTRLDPQKIIDRRAEFLADIAPYVRNPDAAVDNWIVESTANKGNSVPKIDRAIQMGPMGTWEAAPQYQRKGDPESFRYKFAQGTVPPEFGHLEKARSFASVPQAILQKYTKEQSTGEVMTAIRDYFEGAAHRVAFAKAFGANGEKLNFQIAAAVKEAQQAGYSPTSQEVDHLYNLMDAYNGMYNRIQTEGLQTAIGVASTIATMKALPITILSSLVEVAVPAIRGDIKSALLEIGPTIAQVSRDSIRGVFKSIPRNEHALFAAQANITLKASLSIASERLGANVFSRGQAKALKWYFLGNGLTLWTHALSVYATKVGDRIFNDNLRQLSSGLPVTSAKGARLANQLRSMGVPVYTNADAKAIYDPQTFAQRQTSDSLRVLAMRRFKDQTILQPNVADTPLWMSNGHLQVFALLNRYPAAFGNIILPALGRKASTSWAGSRSNAMAGATGALFLLGFMLAVGSMQDELKQIAKNGEVDYDDQRTDAQRFLDILNTTVTPLQVSKALDFVSAPRYGRSGVDTAAGPVVGMATDAIEVGYRQFDAISDASKEPSEGAIWKYLYMQTPLQAYKPGREAAAEIEIFD